VERFLLPGAAEMGDHVLIREHILTRDFYYLARQKGANTASAPRARTRGEGCSRLSVRRRPGARRRGGPRPVFLFFIHIFYLENTFYNKRTHSNTRTQRVRDLCVGEEGLELVDGGGEDGHADAAIAQRRRELFVEAQLRA